MLKILEEQPKPYGPCIKCGELTINFTGSPPLNEVELAEVKAINDWSRELGWCSVHLPGRLLRLPGNFVCHKHKESINK